MAGIVMFHLIAHPLVLRINREPHPMVFW